MKTGQYPRTRLAPGYPHSLSYRATSIEKERGSGSGLLLDWSGGSMAREVIVDRYMARQGTLMIARANFEPILKDYLAHTSQWVGDPDGLILTMMRQGLAAAGLYLTCRPRDETTAWTINLPEPPLNLFFCADAAEGTVVGRYFEENIKTTEHTRFIVQLIRRTGKAHQSIIEVKGYDVLDYFEVYYAKSEQATARFYELSNNEFLMLMALPGTDEDWLTNITADGALQCLLEDEDVKLIEQRPVRFSCPCNQDRMIQVMYSMFEGKESELFGEDESIEASCPRCGEKFSLTRTEFARYAADRKAEDSSDPESSEPNS